MKTAIEFLTLIEKLLDSNPSMKDLRERIHETFLPFVLSRENLIPICSGCNMIRIDGNWYALPKAFFDWLPHDLFTHGVCQACIEKFHPDLYEQIKKKKAHLLSPLP